MPCRSVWLRSKVDYINFRLAGNARHRHFSTTLANGFLFPQFIFHFFPHFHFFHLYIHFWYSFIMFMHCLHFLCGANIYAAQHFCPEPPFFTCPPPTTVIYKCWSWIYYAPSCPSWLSFFQGLWSVDFGDFGDFLSSLYSQVWASDSPANQGFGPPSSEIKFLWNAATPPLYLISAIFRWQLFSVLGGRCHINHWGKRPTCNMLQALVNASFKVASAASTARRGQAAIIVKPKPHKAILQGEVHTQWCECVCVGVVCGPM